VLFGGIIIRYGGVDFGFERAEEEAFAIDNDAGTPKAGGFDEVNAFEAGSGFGNCFSGVLLVFGMGHEAEIRAAVVEAIVIIVVNEEPVGRVRDLAVHPEDVLGLAFAARDGAEGVAGASGAA
jgi:hypothetical protein